MHDPPRWLPLSHLSAALAGREEERVREALEAARESGLPTAEIEETLLQAHLFIGFPDVLRAFFLWREMVSASAEREPEQGESWRDRGERLCRRIYAANYRKLRENVRTLHPDLDRWMVEGGYGRVLSRPGLPLPARELCIVSLLTAWRAPRQLHSHLRGALNAGASPAEVERAVEVGCGALAEPERQEVRNLWEMVRDRASKRTEASSVS